MTLIPGAEFAGYRIVRQLGTGGMGEVYLVENPQLGRREALKIVRTGSTDQHFYDRFNNEARMAAALDHPAIVTIFAHGVEQGTPWFTMSYVEGGDLTRENLGPAGVASVVTQVAGALDYAHARGVVHRDIKPANIVVRRAPDGTIDRTILLDFGIAKSADSAQLTATASFIGSVAYTAPEVLSGGAATPLSDQYSLACTAFELLTGRTPYVSNNVGGVLMAHLSGEIPAVSSIDRSLVPLDPVFQRALAKDPGQRFRSCGEFAAALGAALSGWGAAATRYPTGPAAPAPPYPPQTNQQSAYSGPGQPPYIPVTAQLTSYPPNTSYPPGPTYPPGAMSGPRPPAPAKSKTGLIVAITVIAVLVIAGLAIAAVLTLGNKSSTTTADSSTTETTTSATTSDTTETTESTTSETTTSTSDSVPAGQQVTSPGQAPAGACVKLSGTSADSITVTTASCSGSAELTFISAGTVAASASCATVNYSYVTFSGAGKLCLVPNMTQDNCYQINPNNIVDYSLVGCTATPASGATIYQVTARVTGTATCSATEVAVNYDLPSSLGYCLKPQN